MKRSWLSCTLLTVALTGALAEPRINTDYSFGMYNAYVFRGAKVGNFNVMADGTAAWHATQNFTLTGRVLNITSLGTPTGLLENRLDLSGRYRVNKDIRLLGGYLYYNRNQRNSAVGKSTSEVYAGLEMLYGGVHPSIYVFNDIDRYSGTYWLGTLSRSWVLGTSGWNLDGLAGVGFDGGRRFRGYQNSLISLDLNYPLSPGLEFGPRIDFHFPASKLSPTAKGFRAVGGFGFNYHKDW